MPMPSDVTSTNEESKEVATSTNSPVPSLTLTSTPEVTPTPLSDQVASRTKTLEFTDSIFLRAGPGTNYDKLGSEPAGYVAPVTGKSEDGKWYQIAYGARNRVWVSADWVYIESGTDDIPTIQSPATPTTTVIATEAVVATATQASVSISPASSDAISGKTFTLDGYFVSGPRLKCHLDQLGINCQNTHFSIINEFTFLCSFFYPAKN